jgi:predicted ArsR family transcriptional regulator
MRVLGAAAPDDAGTRGRVLRLVASDGPISASSLAQRLNLTATGVRRHLDELASEGQVAVHASRSGRHGRGRPARQYVATPVGQAGLDQGYADLAIDVLAFLEASTGTVEGFARARAGRLGARLNDVVDRSVDVAERARVVAAVLDANGFAATARPVPGVGAVQLCLGHCPVQEAAERFPQLCDAETEMLGDVLGVHVQRLSTLAAGDHVCTTHVPTGLSAGAPISEGLRA